MLDLTQDAVSLTRSLVDIPSPSGEEQRIADDIEAGLRHHTQWEVQRSRNTVLARTHHGRRFRVVLAGHIDTVPIADNLPSTDDGDRLFGCGSSDMKSGVAVMLRMAISLPQALCDLTLVCYDCEEVGLSRNGLYQLAQRGSDWLTGDLAIVLEPTDGRLELGCQGTLRVAIRLDGRRAHSARSWLGVNAIHSAADILNRLDRYQPRSVDIEGCVYREGLNAVRITGGVANNIIPDECIVTVNYRFAPDRTIEAATEHVREVFNGHELSVIDAAPGAPPCLGHAAVERFLSTIGTEPSPKYGYTDVAQFARLGIPAVNFGPGDPNLAHVKEENVSVERIADCEQILRQFLMTAHFS